MSRGGALILIAAFAAACGGGVPIPDEYLALRVTPGADEVELGRAFPLTVTRIWDKDLEPVEWADDALAPLTLRLVETARREDDRHVEETRLYDAFAFSLDDVLVPAPRFRARPRLGGSVQEVLGDRLTIRVRPALDPEAPGDAELPGGLLDEPGSGWPLPAAGIGALSVLALVVLSRRRNRGVELPESEPEESPPGPHDRALMEIARLRALSPQSAAEVAAFHVDAAGVVRTYLGERFGMRVEWLTTEECVAAAVDGPARSGLAVTLTACDLVKFAKHRPDAPERVRTLDAAEEFVRETAPAGGSR